MTLRSGLSLSPIMGHQFDMDLQRAMRFYALRLLKGRNWWGIPLRLIVGYGFLAHGYAKIVHGPDRFFAILHTIGVPAAEFTGWLTILVEIFGGLAVLVGAFVPFASLPMAAVLLVAMFSVHLPYGFSSIKLISVTATGAQFGQPGYEVDLLYLACLAALVIGGPGPLSVDCLIARQSRRDDPGESSHSTKIP